MSVARKAGPPPDVPSTAWTTVLDLLELLNEFAVFLIEVRCVCRPRADCHGWRMWVLVEPGRGLAEDLSSRAPRVCTCWRSVGVGRAGHVASGRPASPAAAPGGSCCAESRPQVSTQSVVIHPVLLRVLYHALLMQPLPA